MRCWHWQLIPYLPRTQLLAQWRELNSIFKKQDKHILINYVYEYPKEDLLRYTHLVMREMMLRNYKIKSYKNYSDYFTGVIMETIYPFEKHHNKEYLLTCYFNLREKYIRKQDDFYESIFDKLHNFVNEQLDYILDEMEDRL